MIRLAKIDEIISLNELIELSARELSRDDYSQEEIEAAISYIFGVDTDLIFDQTYYVIEEAGVAVACGGWSKRKTLFGGNQFDSRDSGFLDPQLEPAKIRAFFVHPAYARRGLGTQLLTHCEQEAVKHGFSQAEMMATLPGVKLYEKLGYKIISKEDSQLPNGVSIPFMRMSKRIG